MDPCTLFHTKATSLEHVKQESPIYIIRNFFHTQLAQKSWLSRVESIIQALVGDKHQVKNLHNFDKDILRHIYKLVHHLAQSISQNFGENIVHPAHQANGTKDFYLYKFKMD